MRLSAVCETRRGGEGLFGVVGESWVILLDLVLILLILLILSSLILILLQEEEEAFMAGDDGS